LRNSAKIFQLPDLAKTRAEPLRFGVGADRRQKDAAIAEQAILAGYRSSSIHGAGSSSCVQIFAAIARTSARLNWESKGRPPRSSRSFEKTTPVNMRRQPFT
jgi:hypothetical protein